MCDKKKPFTRQDILDCRAEFTWFWGHDFFVETPFGNFHWSDPDYGGDNSFVLFAGDILKFCAFQNVEYGRSKGSHEVERYCGPDIEVRLNNFSIPLPDDLRTILIDEFGISDQTKDQQTPAFANFVKGWRSCVSFIQKSGTKVE